MIPLDLGMTDPGAPTEGNGAAAGLIGQDPYASVSEQSWENTGMGNLAAILVKRESDQSGEKPLTPNQANEMYKGMSVPFTHDVTPRTAAVMYDAELRKRKYAEVQSTIPDTVYGSLRTFAASTLPHLIDPIGATAGLLTGVGFGALGIGAIATGDLAANSALAAGEAAATGFARKVAIQKFTQNAAEGFIGNLATDAIGIAKHVQYKEDLNIGDTLLMNAVTSLGFAGAHAGFRMAVNKLGGDPMLKAMEEAAIGRLMDSKDPTVAGSLLRAHLVSETSGNAFEYNHVAFDQKQPMHSASKINIEYSNADHAPLDVHGNGVYLTDNMNAANGAAARAEQVAGRVYTHDISNLKLVDANTHVPDEVRVRFEEAVGEKINFEQPMNKILSDISTKVQEGNLPESVFNRIDESLTDNGYDGYHYEMDKLMGEDHTKQNVVKVIDPNKLVPTEPAGVIADKAKVGKIPKEKLSEIVKKNAKSFYDNVDKRVTERIETEAPVVEDKPLQKAEESLARLKETEKIPGHTVPEDIAMHEQASLLVDKAKKMPELFDKVQGCL